MKKKLLTFEEFISNDIETTARVGFMSPGKCLSLEWMKGNYIFKDAEGNFIKKNKEICEILKSVDLDGRKKILRIIQDSVESRGLPFDWNDFKQILKDGYAEA